VRRGWLLWVSVALLTGLSAGVAVAQPQAGTQSPSESGGQSKREAKQNPAGTKYEITGVVINSVSGDAVPHCRLTPTLNNPRGGSGNRQFPSPRAASSDFYCDTRGHFTVTVPSAGRWRLVAGARGFVSQAYDAHGSYASAIVLTPEAPTKDVEFRISPEASIAGVVLDEAGEPVRNAQIALQTVPPKSPGGPPPMVGNRSAANTDDRGMYEVANLAPGDYRLSIHAQPWYAAGGQTMARVSSDSNPSPLDPSLDFAYPPTWFPGVSDEAQAEIITLHAGDTRQADFHMVPIPSIHLKILVPPRASNAPNQPVQQSFPMVQQMSSRGGGPGFVQTMTRFDGQGEFDVGGLTPGMYQIRMSGPNQGGRAALVEVGANSARTLDMTAPSSDLAKITVQLDGVDDSDSGSRGERGGVQVVLIDRDTNNGTFSSNREGGPVNGGRGGQRGRDSKDASPDRVIEAPPGRYEVALQGRPNVFLTGLTAKGAEAAGRYVTVGAGDATLTVHMASGRANLSGIATLDGKPVEGAMVLLVPITVEDLNSITFLIQDQTNTDGSFDMANVIPGQYILVAIDHGWQINWGDPSTLRGYLMQGIPVELKSSAIVKQNIVAQTP
jgi:Carboxypeptidase regulatory-like domain